MTIKCYGKEKRKLKKKEDCNIIKIVCTLLTEVGRMAGAKRIIMFFSLFLPQVLELKGLVTFVLYFFFKSTTMDQSL